MTYKVNKANIGQPQEYGLVLTTGLIVATGEAKYSKNQFGKVEAYGEVKKNDLSDFVSGTELDIAYLPEGFKPKTYTVGQATIRETGSASMKMQPVRVIADTDGSIHVLLGQLSGGFKCISFYITFYNYEPIS